MNSENSKNAEPYKLLLNFTDKITLKRRDKFVAFSNLGIYYTWQNTKNSFKNNVE